MIIIIDTRGETMKARDLNTIKAFLKTIPNVKGAYGYGSAFFNQSNNTDHQFDLLLLLDDNNKALPQSEWLLRANYKNTNYFRSSTSNIATMQYILKKEPIFELGTRAIFTPFIPFRDINLKLGLVPYSSACYDCYTWDNLCLPARTSKPIFPIISNSEFEKAVTYNRRQWLLCALLLSNHQTTTYDLYHKICALSYYGDIRQTFHIENPKKIDNIVFGAYSELESLYGTSPLFERQGEIITINDSLLNDMFQKCPNDLYQYMWFHHWKQSTPNEKKKLLEAYFSQKNFSYTTLLALKGLLLTGSKDSITYIKKKLEKKA